MIKKHLTSGAQQPTQSRKTPTQGITREEIRATLSVLDRMIQQGAISKDDVRPHKEALVRSLTNPDQPLGTTESPRPTNETINAPVQQQTPGPPLPSRLLASLTTGTSHAYDTQGRLALPKELVKPEPPASVLTEHIRFPTHTPSKLQVGMVLGKRYRLDAFVGRGCTGQVFRVCDLQNFQTKAIKVFRPKLSQRQGFFDQLNLVQRDLDRLQHRSLVRGYGIEQDAATGLYFHTRDFLEGLSLSDLLERAQKQEISPVFPLTTTHTFLRKLLAALSFLHKHQIIHRNLKPSNIMLVPGPQGLVLKLLDIGFPGELRQGMHPIQDKEEVSKLFYSSPEQLTGEGPFAPATDIYSVGILLYVMLTGVFPSALAPHPSELDPAFTRSLDRTLQSAVRMDAKQRPQSCPDFFGALSQALHVTPNNTTLFLPKELISRPPKAKPKAQQKLPWPEEVDVDSLRDTRPNKIFSLELGAAPLPVALVPPMYHAVGEEAAGGPLLSLPILNASMAPPQSQLNQSGTFLATSHNPGSVQLWEVGAWRPLYNIRSPHAFGTITSLAWSHTNDFLAFASANGDVWVWNCLNDQCVAHFQHTSPVRCLLWLPEDRSLCVGCADGRIHFWSPVRKVHLGYNKSHKNPISAMVCHPTAPYLASSDQGGYTHMIDLETGQTQLALPPADGALHSLAFSQRDGHLLVGGHDGMVQQWDLEQGTPQHFCLGHRGAINALEVCNKRPWFVSGADDGTLGIWSLETGQRIATFEGHRAPVHSISIGKEGRWLTSASEDGTLKIWRLSTLDKLL